MISSNVNSKLEIDNAKKYSLLKKSTEKYLKTNLTNNTKLNKSVKKSYNNIFSK